MKIGF